MGAQVVRVDRGDEAIDNADLNAPSRDSLSDRGATPTLSNRQGPVGSTAAAREDPIGGIRGARAAPGVEWRTSQVLVFGGTSVASPNLAERRLGVPRVPGYDRPTGNATGPKSPSSVGWHSHRGRQNAGERGMAWPRMEWRALS